MYIHIILIKKQGKLQVMCTFISTLQKIIDIHIKLMTHYVYTNELTKLMCIHIKISTFKLQFLIFYLYTLRYFTCIQIQFVYI